MSAILSPESDVFKALRAALIAVLGVEVVKGLSNRVSQPECDYVAISPLLQDRLSTNASIFNDDARQESHDADYQVQADFYGETSGDMAAIVVNLFRSSWLKQYGISPLYASSPRQLMFQGADKQMMERWTVDLHLFYESQVNLPPQQSAIELIINPIMQADK